jgi:hypothetical protein
MEAFENFYRSLLHFDLRKGQGVDWSVAIEGLSKPEQVVRFKSLQAILRASDHLYSAVSTVRQAHTLSRRLCTIATEDEHEKTRAMSLLALSKVIALSELDQNITGNARRIVNSSFETLLRLIKSGKSYPKYAPIIVQAIGPFLEDGPHNFRYNTEQSLLYLLEKKWAESMEDSQIHVFIVGTILFTLCRYYTRTPDNRERIRRFLPSIFEIYRSSTSTNDSKDGANSFRHNHPFIIEALSYFFSFWYPRAAELYVKCLPMKLIKKHPGYALRLRRWLEVRGTWTLVSMKKKSHDKPIREHINKAIEKINMTDRIMIEKKFFADLKSGKAFDRILPHSKQLLMNVMQSKGGNKSKEELVFDNSKYTRKVEIQNTSKDTDHAFWIQAEPSTFFKVTPAYGVLKAQSHLDVEVSFVPDFKNPNWASKQIVGFLRLRAGSGFVMKRLGLLAFNAPLLRVTNNALDFGFCPPGESRTLPLLVENICMIRSTCTVYKPVHDVHFQAYPIRSSIEVGDMKQISVVYEPKVSAGNDEEHNSVLTVLGMGGESYPIGISGVAGNQVEVLTKAIDFDILEDSVPGKQDRQKILEIQNKSTTEPAVVTIKASSVAIKIRTKGMEGLGEDAENHTIESNDGTLVINIPRQDSAEIYVSVRPPCSGLWEGTIIINAPNSRESRVSVSAVKTPLLEFPFGEDISLPMVEAGQEYTFELPLLSPMSKMTCEVVVHVDQTFPAVGCEIKSVEGGKLRSVKHGTPFTVRSAQCIPCSFHFQSKIPGKYRIPFKVEIISPVSVVYGPWYVNCIVREKTEAIEDMLIEEYLDGWRSFMLLNSKESSSAQLVEREHLMKEEEKNSPIARNDGEEKFHSTLKLTPIRIEMYRMEKERSNIAAIFVSNDSNLPQSYHLIPSFQLVGLGGEEVLDGVVPPKAKVKAQFQVSKAVSVQNNVCFYASITAVDDFGQIIGKTVISGRDKMPVECICSPDFGMFLGCGLSDSRAHKMVVRNLSPWDTQITAQIGIGKDTGPFWLTEEGTEQGKAGDGKGKKKKAKSRNLHKGYLPPWSATIINLTFMSIANGDFEELFDLLFLPGNGASRFVSLFSKPLHATSIEKKLTVSTDFFDFGDVREGEATSCEVQCSNESNVPINARLVVAHPFSTGKSKVNIPSNSIVNINLEYKPDSGMQHMGALRIVYGMKEAVVLLLGRTGVLALDSNLGEPSTHNNDNASLSNNAEVIDLGIVDTGKKVGRQLRMFNTGSMDIIIAKISSTVGLTWSSRANDELSGLDRVRNGEKFREADGDMLEIDWDEVDYQLSLGTDASRVFFPVCLKPGQSFPVDILLDTENVIGEFFSSIEIWCLKTPSQHIGEAESRFTFDFKAISQPALQFNSLHSNLGPVLTNDTRTEVVSFTNIGVVSVPWAVKILEKTHTNLLPACLSENNDDDDIDLTAFFLSKSEGVLHPGKTQEVTISFEPSIPHMAYAIKLGLISDISHSNDSSSIFDARGIGAQPLLRLNKFEATDELSEMIGKHDHSVDETLQTTLQVNFGSIKLATKKKISVMLVNCGNLDGNFRVDNISSRFSVRPREGSVRAQSFRRLDIYFEPLTEKDFTDVIRVIWGEKKSPDLRVYAMGSGGHPSLHVESQILDFKVALLNVPSRQEFKLNNNGNAETFVDIEIPPKHFIRTEPTAPVIVEPNSSRNVTVVFTPRKLMNLEGELRIQSLENKHDIFYVKLAGVVGKPQLDIHPSNTMELLNYGTALIDKEHKKTFVLENKGTMECIFKCFFVKPRTEGHLQKAKETLAEAPEVDSDEKDIIGAPKKRLKATMEELYLGMPEAFEACLSDVFDITPKEGLLEKGGSIHFEATFSPIEREKQESSILVIETPFRTFVGKMKGVGGQPSLSLDLPSGLVDFGVCRAGGKYERIVNVINTGNVEYAYKIMADPHDPLLNPRHKPPGFSWARVAESNGIRFKMGGVCKPYKTAPIKVIFSPTEGHINRRKDMKFIIKYMSGTQALRVMGNCSMPELAVYDATKRHIDDKSIHLGFHRVGTTHEETFTLANNGSVPSNFFITHNFTDAFTVTPESGLVKPHRDRKMKVTFHPHRDGEFKLKLTVVSDANKVINTTVTGNGGVPSFQPIFVDPKDQAIKGIDFDLVNVNCLALKNFVIGNYGTVESTCMLASSSPHFTLKTPRHVQINKSSTGAYLLSGVDEESITTSVGSMSLNINLKPLEERVISVLLKTSTEGKHYAAEISFKSEFDQGCMAARGQAGSVHFLHHGNLNFGRIACNHTYTQKITVHNSGTLLTDVRFCWELPKADCKPLATDVRVGSHLSATLRGNRVQMKVFRKNLVKLKSTGTSVGRRKLWKFAIRRVILMVKMKTLMMGSLSKNSGKRSINSKRRAKREQQTATLNEEKDEQLKPKKPSGISNNPRNRNSSANMKHAQELLRNKGLIIQQTISKFVDSYEIAMKEAVSAFAEEMEMVKEKSEVPVAMMKSRDIFTIAKSLKDRFGSFVPASMASPHIQVTPSHATLSHSIAQELLISVHISRPGRFRGRLLLTSRTTGVSDHSIPLMFSAEVAELVFSDNAPLNFGTLSIGASATVLRQLTNKSRLQIAFRVRTGIDGLTISPARGSLEPGMAMQLRFKFRPMENRCYDGEINFESDCSNPLSLQFIGSGGVSKLKMDVGEKVDFGRCMMGAVASQKIKVTNAGNALLTFQHCDAIGLHDTEQSVFRLSTDWPAPNTGLKEGESMDLTVEFIPKREEIASALLTLRTSDKDYHINLVGTGREVSVRLSKHHLMFRKCIVGNNYQHSLRVANRGDTTYTAAVRIDNDATGAVKVMTGQISVKPFSHTNVIVTFEPTEEVKGEVMLVLGSDQYHQSLPVSIEAGTAELELEPASISFGKFHVDEPPTDKSFKIINTGTSTFSFRIRRSDEHDGAPPYKLSQWEGRLPPETSCTVRATFCGSLGKFCENLFIETEKMGFVKFFVCRGHCAAPSMKFDTERTVQYGPCLVGKRAGALVKFRNDGDYVLNGAIIANYPIRANKTEISVSGNGHDSLELTWIPTGCYELKSTVSVETNAGNFLINVRGNGVFPKLKAAPSVLDFGVCAIGHEYAKTLKITNLGECTTRWNIPTMPSGFQCSAGTGELKSGESDRVEVTFVAANKQARMGSFIIESRGKYRTVTISGIGGAVSLKCAPGIIHVGKRVRGKRVESLVEVTNTGEVPLSLRLGQMLPPSTLSQIEVSLPGLDDGLAEGQDGPQDSVLSSSFGPARNQWPRVTVHPSRMVLNPLQTSKFKISILFHPDRDFDNSGETGIELLSEESTWNIPIRWDE